MIFEKRFLAIGLAIPVIAITMLAARAVCDASWRELRSMLEYKSAWYGRRLVVVDRWLPSSKLCSACGALRDGMPLGVRTWECACGTVHDRDVNAARNILAAGLAER